MSISKKPILKSMNRGIPIYLNEVDKVLLPVFKCGYTSAHSVYPKHGKLLASFNDLIDYKGVEKVTMVRNPYARIVSLWTCQNNRDHLHEVSSNFEQFVENVEKLLQEGFIDGHYNSLVENLSIQGEFIPTTLFKMEEGVDKLVEYLGVDVQFPKKNVSENKKPYQEYYTERAKEIVDRIYKEDFDLLGYTFQ